MHYSLLVVAIFGALAIRLVMHFVDKARIKGEVESQGSRVISIKWNPFGRGWFFEKGERHYDVVYIDRSGGTFSSGCKTSLFTGVYWAEGPLVREPPTPLMARHRCAHCGYALSAEWRACPQCGKATEFA
jgi:hypothetical protein